MGLKRVKPLSPILEVVCEWISVQQTNMPIRNGCSRSDRMDVFVQGQPVSAEKMSLFGQQMCLFGTAAPVTTEQMCLFRIVMPITIEWIYLL